MVISFFFFLLILLGLGYKWGTRVALIRKKKAPVLPKSFGWYMVCWTGLTPLILSLLFMFSYFAFPSFFSQNSSFFGGYLIVSAFIGLIGARLRLQYTLKPQHFVEKLIVFCLFIAALISILTSVAIIFSLMFEAYRFFQHVSPFHFLFGLNWSPQLAQYDPTHAFGILPLFTGTFLITSIALCIALPLGLFSAIYLAEYACEKKRLILKPLLEMLAGIPTVVYGFFAVVLVAPFFQKIALFFHCVISSESALTAGVVMGIMLIPFISSLCDDVIRSVPKALRDAGFGLGATQSEIIRQIILPAAFPGIIGATLLALSRAIGETMLVVMAAGLSASLTTNPLKSVTTVTVQIVSLLTGDQEFDSPQTLAAFALGLILFIMTLGLNFIALKIIRLFREQYD